MTRGAARAAGFTAAVAGLMFFGAAIAAGNSAATGADGWIVERVAPQVVMVYDDAGQWGGASMGTSHQVNPDYQARKVIDLSAVPDQMWRRVKAARVRVFFAIQDYSWALHNIEYDGLDEEFEVVVNGHAHRYRTDAGFGARAKASDKLEWRWTDFPVPVTELRRGPNEIVFRKAADPAKKHYDDYIYVGIDNTVEHGHSAVSFDGGKTWTSEQLNSIKARGEYMVRLVLITGELGARAAWVPGPGRAESSRGEPLGPGRVDDPVGVVGLVETDGQVVAEGVKLAAGCRASVWLASRFIDPLEPIRATVQFSGAAPQVRWLDDDGEAVAAKTHAEAGSVTAAVTAPRAVPRRLVIEAVRGQCTVRRVELSFGRNYLPPPVIDMCPTTAATPARKARAGRPLCRRRGETLVVGDGLLRAEFSVGRSLTLRSLSTGFSERPLIVPADARSVPQIFIVEVGDKRFSLADFALRELRIEDGRGFRAEMELETPRLRAVFACRAEGEGRLRFSLELTNRSSRTVLVKTLFPLLAGIDAPYYLYPCAGGVIADVPTYLRVAYGENLAWWQMIDVFRPAEGFGLMLRADDPAASFKCPALRKGRTYDSRFSVTRVGNHMDPELPWRDSLPAVDGISMGFEYLRRTLKPGARLKLPDAVACVHRGDFHRAMEIYSAWAHRTWKYRPYPGPLADHWNLTPVGWGQSPLVNKKGWRTDYLNERADVVEMMSWWEWSDLGPWRVPMDHKLLKEKLGEALYKRYKAYWVVDPIAGRLRYPLNRGDYKYSETWGGLEAFRRHIRRVKRRGIMAGVYIDGILACDTTEVGHKYGPIYGVVNPFWKDYYKCPLSPKGYVAAYASWNMCCDTEWWANYLSHTVARIFRDTGIDYLRIDEFGHAGYPCYSTKHKHMFAPEPGHNGWLQGCAEICRRAHELMDRIRPGLALTTEFPGTDHMAAYLDGAITHEAAYRRPAIRPVPCNLLRFYFPSCKPMDLDYIHVPDSHDIKLWNAMMAFGYRYPDKYLQLLREHTDAFGRGKLEALVPTLRRRVYANRFSSADKVVVALYNARPYPVAGPVFEVREAEGYRFVELLSGRELELVRVAGRLAVALRIEPHRAVAVARLKRHIASVRAGDEALSVKLDRAMRGCAVRLSDLDNAMLADVPVEGREVVVRSKKWARAKSVRPLLVKLVRDGIVLDMVRVD